MVDTLENELCDRLGEVLEPIEVGEEIGALAAFEFVLGALENYISHVIREVHPEFGGAVDGFESVTAKKTGSSEIELWGAAFVISCEPDIVTPVHVRMRIDPKVREVCWMECRLGMQQNGQLASLSPGRLQTVIDRIASKDRNFESIRWAYEVGFGER